MTQDGGVSYLWNIDSGELRGTKLAAASALQVLFKAFMSTASEMELDSIWQPFKGGASELALTSSDSDRESCAMI